MAVNTFVRQSGAWVPIGTIVEPPPPDPDPGDPPPQPSTIAGGWELPGTSLEALDVIGPRGARTPWTGPSTLSGTQVIENKEFTNFGGKLAPGAHITLVNCKLTSSPKITKYMIDMTATTGDTRLDLESCELVARAGGPSTRTVALWGNGFFSARRTIFRGGIDNLFLKPENVDVGPYATGSPYFPTASLLIEECWLGDLERVPNSHSDNVQIEKGTGIVFRRNWCGSFNIPEGTDPINTRTNPLTSELGGGGFITTQQSTAPTVIKRILIEKNFTEGGNNTLDCTPDDGIPVTEVYALDNRSGPRRRFSPFLVPGPVNSRNIWGGDYSSAQYAKDKTMAVTFGQLVPGSSA